MKKLLLITAAMLFVGVTQAQDAESEVIVGYTTPNYEQIRKDIADKQSDRYYPKLAKRFVEGDTSLNEMDMQAFYYGQAFLEDYSPYRHYDEFDEIRAIMNKDEAPTKADARNIIKLANAVIAKNPAEPMAYYYLNVGHVIAEDIGEMFKAQWQFQMLLFSTIAGTGDGTTPELAMHVVSTSHEYMMMSMYGFQMKKQELMSINGHSYDMFVLDSNKYGVDTLYFNIDCIVNSWSSLFSEKDELGHVISIDFVLGFKFVLELDDPKRKNSKFVLVSKEPVFDTLISNRDSLFREPVPENQIVGYFCPMRLYEGDESVYNCLVFISNCKNDWLYYDTYIAPEGQPGDFRPTSNGGMLRGAMMNEMWHPADAHQIRISNIRIKK